jgi:hypothetical protein
MNRRVGIGSSDGSISANNKVLTRRSSAPDEPMVYASVHPTASRKLTKANNKVLPAKSSAPDELTVCRLKRHMSCVNGREQWKTTASSTRWTDVQKKHSIGSSDGTTFRSFGPTTSLMPWPIFTPSTSPFKVAGLCGSAEECKILSRSYPSHPNSKLLIQRLHMLLCVRSARLSLELSECKMCLHCEVILEWIKLYKVCRKPWGLSGSLTNRLRPSGLVWSGEDTLCGGRGDPLPWWRSAGSSHIERGGLNMGLVFKL